MDHSFDAFLESLSEPLPEAPVYAPDPVPESQPMQPTVLVDLATEVENKGQYIDESKPKKFEQRKQEGFEMAPPVDIYEPGFRTDLVAAIQNYFAEQKRIRDNNERIRKITGIGRGR